MKKAKNTFTTLQANMVDLKEEKSDLLDSDEDSHKYVFFLSKDNYQGLKPKGNASKQNLLYNDRKKISI